MNLSFAQGVAVGVAGAVAFAAVAVLGFVRFVEGLGRT